MAVFLALGCGDGSSNLDAGMDAGEDGGVDGGGDEGGDESQQGPATAMEACQSMVGAICELAVGCPMFTSIDFQLCMAAFGIIDCEVLGVSEDEGRIVYSRSKAVGCIEAITNLPCDSLLGILPNLFSLVPACEEMFEPQVATGGECTSSFDCTGGCVTSDRCPGECVAFVAIDQACDEENNLYCDSKVAYCDGVCTARGSAGSTCEYPGQCQVGLVCVFDQCQPYGGVSTPCDPASSGYTGCAWEFYCDQLENVCRPRKALDAACLQPIDMFDMNGECERGLECIGSVCTPLPGLDGACEPDLNPSSCQLEFYCDEITSRCLPRPGRGQSCDIFERPCLGTDLYCDQNLNTCATRKGEGENCVENSECESVLTCEEGSCVRSLCW